MRLTCRKCGSQNLGLRQNMKNPKAEDLLCLDCGAWQKFANADDRRIYPVINGMRLDPPRGPETASWEWFENWTESTPDGPAECMDAGWRCAKCGFSLNEISHCFDDPDTPPPLKYCPECGKKMAQGGGGK